ncbi:GNAT family N-acetyltransferase [Microbulbifer magnicolonia]|uniref:GNAT family N-acetyltransferase n=1 Tax=Microbulbifer magnicolonia TaxID=3109744 RepID=UPI002B40B26C|nr:GNAT family N-acetyltransferase [Microbulbifer sp. GG15]
MFQLETPKLLLRQLTENDAPLMLAVLNDPDFLRNVGDRGVRTEADARRYIIDGPMSMYHQYGFGMYKVELKDGTAIGLCGLVKRDGLDDVDIGFAFLPRYRGHGYALEAAEAVMEYARTQAALKRVVAITLPDNTPSVRLLEKIGLQPEKHITLPNGTEELLLMAWDAEPGESHQ